MRAHWKVGIAALAALAMLAPPSVALGGTAPAVGDARVDNVPSLDGAGYDIVAGAGFTSGIVGTSHSMPNNVCAAGGPYDLNVNLRIYSGADTYTVAPFFDLDGAVTAIPLVIGAGQFLTLSFAPNGGGAGLGTLTMTSAAGSSTSAPFTYANLPLNAFLGYTKGSATIPFFTTRSFGDFSVDGALPTAANTNAMHLTVPINVLAVKTGPINGFGSFKLTRLP